MGQAERRGTFEQRKAFAIQREEERIVAIEAERRLRYQQEGQAYATMVWWQIEMSERRYYQIKKLKMARAQFFGILYGAGFGAMYHPH